jgi:hypothetical protein
MRSVDMMLAKPIINLSMQFLKGKKKSMQLVIRDELALINS